MVSNFLILSLFASASFNAASTALKIEKNLSAFNTSIFIGDKEVKLNKYFSVQELEDLLEVLGKKFENIVKLHVIGESKVDNHKIHAVQISENVKLERKSLKPMMKFVANLEGDEIVGYALMVSLIQYLVYSYGVNDRITDLLNSTDIWIVPTLRRHPPSRLDCKLARDFTTANFLDSSHCQPETKGMIDLIMKHPFVLSAHIRHGNAIVASYPFEYKYEYKDTWSKNATLKVKGCFTPDHKFFKKLAQDYAQENSMMKRGIACGRSFPGGIAHGLHRKIGSLSSMQDNNYIMSNCFEITLYLSCPKNPPASELPRYWNANLNSMLKFIQSVHQGVYGYVKDIDGKPVTGALITVTLHGKKIKVTPRGEYWRLLLPGSHGVIASADGYTSQVEKVNLTEQKPLVNLDFVLRRASVYGKVIKYDGEILPEAVITVLDDPYSYDRVKKDPSGIVPKDEITAERNKSKVMHVMGVDSDGIYGATLSPGSYILKVSGPGFKVGWTTVDVSETSSEKLDFIMEIHDYDTKLIRGFVVDSKDHPIVDATVKIARPLGKVAEIPVETDGEFQWRVEYGKYYLSVTAPGYVNQGRKIHIKEDMDDEKILFKFCLVTNRSNISFVKGSLES